MYHRYIGLEKCFKKSPNRIEVVACCSPIKQKYVDKLNLSTLRKVAESLDKITILETLWVLIEIQVIFHQTVDLSEDFETHLYIV